MTHWWRAYDDAIDHPKLLRLSDAMHRAWWTLQCVASSNNGSLPPTADIALRLRLKPSKVTEWISALVKAELLDECEGVFKPHNWDARQYKTDAKDPTNAQRQRAFRQRDATVRNEVRNALRNGVTSLSAKRPDTEQITTSTFSVERAEARQGITSPSPQLLEILAKGKK